MEFLLSKLCFSFSFSKKKTCFSFLYEIDTVNQWMMRGEVVRIGFFFLVMSVTTWWRFGNKYRRVLLCSVALMLTSIIPYTPSDTGMYTSVRPFQPTRRQAGRDQIWRPKKKINPRRLTCGGLSTGSDAVVHAFIHFSFRFSDRSLCSWHLAPKRGCRTRAVLLLFWRVAATSK